MKDTNTACTAINACDARDQPAARAQRGAHLGLTLLAVTTAAAILLSGANALVQMVRVLAQCWLARG